MVNLIKLENEFDLFLDDQIEYLSLEDKIEYLDNLKHNISYRIDDLEEEDES